MDHLQTDIDSLESEKGQLKEKLKSIGKKTLSTSGADNISSGTSLTSAMDNKYYVQEINALREALNNEHLQKKKIMCDVLRQKLDSLEPLSTPANLRSLDSTIQDLRKKTTDLVKVPIDVSTRRLFSSQNTLSDKKRLAYISGCPKDLGVSDSS